MATGMSAQKAVTPTAEGLAASAKAAKTRGLPPVHLWNPPFCGDIDMRIARDGTWFYEGSRIQRHELVRLFSSILKREGHAYFLVTPVEKVGIIVDDAPFVAVDFTVVGHGDGQDVTFETHVGDMVRADSNHPIRVALDPASGEPAPYVMVRDGLEALIARSVFYQLVDIGEEQEVDGQTILGLWSGGEFFTIGATTD